MIFSPPDSHKERQHSRLAHDFNRSNLTTGDIQHPQAAWYCWASDRIYEELTVESIMRVKTPPLN